MMMDTWAFPSTTDASQDSSPTVTAGDPERMGCEFSDSSWWQNGILNTFTKDLSFSAENKSFDWKQSLFVFIYMDLMG